MRTAAKIARKSAGVTLIELLIAVLLLSLLSVGMVLTLRVALSAMNKTDSKLMANRRVASVERIVGQQIEGLIPVTADCRALPDVQGQRIMFFEGETRSMRLASSYSLQQGARGQPMILEYQVIPGENDQGVRLVVNEQWYTGPRAAGALCFGVGRDPDSGLIGPRFVPIQIGANSFVLADHLAYCRFTYRDDYSRERPYWLEHWSAEVLPNAIRIDLAPLTPDPGRLQPVTLTIPVHVTRLPFEEYDKDLANGG